MGQIKVDKLRYKRHSRWESRLNSSQLSGEWSHVPVFLAGRMGVPPKDVKIPTSIMNGNLFRTGFYRWLGHDGTLISQDPTQMMSLSKGGLSTQLTMLPKKTRLKTHEQRHLQAKELLEQPEAGIEPTTDFLSLKRNIPWPPAFRIQRQRKICCVSIPDLVLPGQPTEWIHRDRHRGLRGIHSPGSWGFKSVSLINVCAIQS